MRASAQLPCTSLCQHQEWRAATAFFFVNWSGRPVPVAVVGRHKALQTWISFWSQAEGKHSSALIIFSEAQSATALNARCALEEPADTTHVASLWTCLDISQSQSHPVHHKTAARLHFAGKMTKDKKRSQDVEAVLQRCLAQRLSTRLLTFMDETSSKSKENKGKGKDVSMQLGNAKTLKQNVTLVLIAEHRSTGGSQLEAVSHCH